MFARLRQMLALRKTDTRKPMNQPMELWHATIEVYTIFWLFFFLNDGAS